MRRRFVILIFIGVVLIQLFIPAQMIFDQEDILSNGTPYKFKTLPIDPNDPFRGKYITLSYDIDSYETDMTSWNRKENVYVYLERDSLGFAKIKSISKLPGDSKSDFVIAKSPWYSPYDSTLNFDYEFDRFYMEEFKAKPAEDLVRRREDSLKTHALVYVKNGKGLVKDVFINDIPISKYIEQQQKNPR